MLLIRPYLLAILLVLCIPVSCVDTYFPKDLSGPNLFFISAFTGESQLKPLLECT